MAGLNRTDLERLMKTPDGDCVSLYLGLNPNPQQSSPAEVCLKNLLAEAESELIDRGMRPVEARELLAPADDLARSLRSEAAGKRGLAVFACADHFEKHYLTESLPDAVFVYSRFHITPLVRLLTNEEVRYHVLAVSQNRVRLLACSREQAVEVELADLPANLDAALNNQPPDPAIQFHGGTKHGKARQTTVYHGQGGASDYKKEELAAYLRQIDEAVCRHLQNQQTMLVFAGVDYLLPLYRQVSRFGHLMDEHVAGNPDGMTEQELHEATWPIMERRLHQSVGIAIQKCSISIDDDPSAREFAPVLRALHTGRVETLAVAGDQQVWGNFDPTTGRMCLSERRHQDDEELINLAVMAAIEHGTDVVILPTDEMPSRLPLAAVFRYRMARSSAVSVQA